MPVLPATLFANLFAEWRKYGPNAPSDIKDVLTYFPPSETDFHDVVFRIDRISAVIFKVMAGGIEKDSS